MNTYNGTGWSYQDYESNNDWVSALYYTGQSFITHACNYQAYLGNDELTLFVFIGGDSWYWLSDIDVGERAIIYVLGSSVENWYSYLSLPYYDPEPVQHNIFRHGVMGP